MSKRWVQIAATANIEVTSQVDTLMTLANFVCIAHPRSEIPLQCVRVGPDCMWSAFGIEKSLKSFNKYWPMVGLALDVSSELAEKRERQRAFQNTP
jgi:hypothetical protein